MFGKNTVGWRPSFFSINIEYLMLGPILVLGLGVHRVDSFPLVVRVLCGGWFDYLMLGANLKISSLQARKTPTVGGLKTGNV